MRRWLLAIVAFAQEVGGDGPIAENASPSGESEVGAYSGVRAGGHAWGAAGNLDANDEEEDDDDDNDDDDFEGDKVLWQGEPQKIKFSPDDFTFLKIGVPFYDDFEEEDDDGSSEGGAARVNRRGGSLDSEGPEGLEKTLLRVHIRSAKVAVQAFVADESIVEDTEEGIFWASASRESLALDFKFATSNFCSWLHGAYSSTITLRLRSRPVWNNNHDNDDDEEVVNQPANHTLDNTTKRMNQASAMHSRSPDGHQEGNRQPQPQILGVESTPRSDTTSGPFDGEGTRSLGAVHVANDRRDYKAVTLRLTAHLLDAIPQPIDRIAASRGMHMFSLVEPTNDHGAWQMVEAEVALEKIIRRHGGKKKKPSRATTLVETSEGEGGTKRNLRVYGAGGAAAVFPPSKEKRNLACSRFERWLCLGNLIRRAKAQQSPELWKFDRDFFPDSVSEEEENQLRRVDPAKALPLQGKQTKRHDSQATRMATLVPQFIRGEDVFKQDLSAETFYLVNVACDVRFDETSGKFHFASNDQEVRSTGDAPVVSIAPVPEYATLGNALESTFFVLSGAQAKDVDVLVAFGREEPRSIAEFERVRADNRDDIEKYMKAQTRHTSSLRILDSVDEQRASFSESGSRAISLSPSDVEAGGAAAQRYLLWVALFPRKDLRGIGISVINFRESITTSAGGGGVKPFPLDSGVHKAEDGTLDSVVNAALIFVLIAVIGVMIAGIIVAVRYVRDPDAYEYYSSQLLSPADWCARSDGRDGLPQWDATSAHRMAIQDSGADLPVASRPGVVDRQGVGSVDGVIDRTGVMNRLSQFFSIGSGGGPFEVQHAEDQPPNDASTAPSGYLQRVDVGGHQGERCVAPWEVQTGGAESGNVDEGSIEMRAAGLGGRYHHLNNVDGDDTSSTASSARRRTRRSGKTRKSGSSKQGSAVRAEERQDDVDGRTSPSERSSENREPYGVQYAGLVHQFPSASGSVSSSSRVDWLTASTNKEPIIVQEDEEDELERSATFGDGGEDDDEQEDEVTAEAELLEEQQQEQHGFAPGLSHISNVLAEVEQPAAEPAGGGGMRLGTSTVHHMAL